MIPLALVLVGLALWALIWAIRSGQLDDLESQGWSVVLDDDQQPMQGAAEPGRAEGGSQPEPRVGASRARENPHPPTNNTEQDT
jgi:cbb3-type cytochrome oxidase maturation protein